MMSQLFPMSSREAGEKSGGEATAEVSVHGDVACSQQTMARALVRMKLAADGQQGLCPDK